MRILVAFATTDGHTRKLAGFAAETLRGLGHDVVLCDCAHPGQEDPSRYDAVVLAGSLHMGRFQGRLRAFAHAHASALNARPSAFVAVSLSAAGHDPADRAGLASCIDHFLAETGWRPSATHEAAGAFMFTRYGFLERLALRRIARKRGLALDVSQDHDLTDYHALAAFLRHFSEKAVIHSSVRTEFQDQRDA